MVGVVQPVYKRLVVADVFGKLGEALVQLVAVVVDKLAGNYRKALGHIAVEVVISALQQGQKLAGE